ncbi:MAG: Lnb N-terminal periplasmic domain-containing protein [Planctomycetota bacterium]|jgi:hypothetical protein
MPDGDGRRPRPLFRVARGVVGIPAFVLMGAWATAAIYFTRIPGPLPWIAAGLFAAIVVILFRQLRWRATPWFLVAWLVVLVLYQLKSPSNDRDWRTDVAVLATAELEGDRATVRNVRNFRYRTLEDFDVRYDDRTYDLTKLRRVDFIFCYWGNAEAVAHTMTSFGFEGGEQLVVSIEIRPEKGESYNPLAGLFKHYEIIYVVGDERDLVRVRTNFREERVFIFRSEMTPADGRLLLEHMLARVSELEKEPAYYGTILRNCTTALVDHVNAIWPNDVPITRKILMNGYAPEQAYERGTIPNHLPFEEIKRACFVSDIARRAADDAGFSAKIRAHLP